MILEEPGSEKAGEKVAGRRMKSIEATAEAAYLQTANMYSLTDLC